jgi:polyphosphate glucokinase
MAVLGIDIGGSAVKGGVVDVEQGTLTLPRQRLPTPEMTPPDEIASMIDDIRKNFDYTGPIGIGFPAPVLHNVPVTAANVHQEWIGLDVSQLVSRVTGCPTFVLNDADAAGIAEMEFGAGRECMDGVVMLMTLGTGIGTAFFTHGVLLPNTEFGHIDIRGKDAERRASDAARKRKNLSWDEWAERFQEYITIMEHLFYPDLIIIGGGMAKFSYEFFPLIKTRAKMVAAQLLNEAGIVGAGMYAYRNVK